MCEKVTGSEAKDEPSGMVKNSATLAGFLIFLSGCVLVLVAMLDIVVRMDSLKTGAYLIIGVVMFKLGHGILRHFAAFKTQRERRRSPRS